MFDSLARYIGSTKKSRAVHCIVASGDIATTGGKGDIEYAYNLTIPSISRLKYGSSEIQPLGLESTSFMLIPGNHDRFPETLSLDNMNHTNGEYPSSKFDEIFTDTELINDRIYCKTLESDNEHLVLLGIDLSLRCSSDSRPPNSPTCFGQGKAYSDTLANLKRITLDMKEKDKGGKTCVVWITHYPPSFKRGPDALSLIKSKDLISAARKCKVKLILSGHQHIYKRYVKKGITIITSGTACGMSDDPINSINLCNILVKNGNIVSISSNPLVYKGVKGRRLQSFTS